jgi:battenin
MKMSRSPSASIMLPLPGSPASSWALYRARFSAIFQGANPSVLLAFWLFGNIMFLPISAISNKAIGLVNNVLYVIILSAALDLVGPEVPKGIVLLADVMPSFITKLIAPYFIHRIPYQVRIIIFVILSSGGMVLIALTPSDRAVSIKLVGIVIGSLSSGGGELSFLGLTHYYGPFSLAAWSSGTGGAGLIGAGLYVLMTTWIGFTVKHSLLASAFLPLIMLLGFFVILPHDPLKFAKQSKDYDALPATDINESDMDDAPSTAVSSSLLGTEIELTQSSRLQTPTFASNLRRVRLLFFPYMIPLLLVYIAEYTINQGVAPTLLFPLESTPFAAYRDFYPTYALLYQVGVFIARSSTPFYRTHKLYLLSILQIVNLVLLILQSLLGWIPSVWLVFLIIFWEGLLGGAVYVNTFAEIMESVPEHDREFSLGATSVSDSGGICIAGFVGMVLEVFLCNWQVKRGKNWCKQL